MKLTFKAEYLKFLTLGAGVLGLVLRIALYAAGIDGRGLLVENHWTRIGITVLTVMTGLILALRCLRISGPRRYRSSYPASAAAALGCAVCGTAVLITGISEFSPDDRTSILASLAAFAAGISLLTLTFFRLRGKRPPVLLHGLVSVFFAFRMIRQYSIFSANPQIQDFGFLLCAYAALMLSAYHHAEFDAGVGNHKRLWLFSLAGVYLCLLALKGSGAFWFPLCCGIWVFTNLTNLSRHRKAAAASEHPEAED